MKSTIPVFTESESFHKRFYQDFNIQSFKDKPEGDLNRMEPHRHTYYEIIWVKEGWGTHLVDFKTYDFNGPCLFILQPGVVHKIFKAVPSKGQVVKFSASFFAGGRESTTVLFDLFDNIDARPIFHLDESMVLLLDDLMQKMVVEYNQRNDLSREILKAYLKVFLLQVHKLREYHTKTEAANSPRYALLQKFKRLVEKHFIEERQLGFYTKKLATSARNLNDITQNFIGKSATAIIKERTLLEAKRLLYGTSQSVKEIAYELGFEDPAYFTRFFSKHTGLKPSEFKNSQV